MPAIITFGGLAAAGLALMLFGLVHAGAIAIATLCYAGFGRSIVGNTSLRSGVSVDPKEVRRYRIEHPGTTISEATAAVAGRR